MILSCRDCHAFIQVHSMNVHYCLPTFSASFWRFLIVSAEASTSPLSALICWRVLVSIYSSHHGWYFEFESCCLCRDYIEARDDKHVPSKWHHLRVEFHIQLVRCCWRGLPSSVPCRPSACSTSRACGLRHPACGSLSIVSNQLSTTETKF